jgi:hypothetical protein
LYGEGSMLNSKIDSKNPFQPPTIPTKIYQKYFTIPS